MGQELAPGGKKRKEWKQLWKEKLLQYYLWPQSTRSKLSGQNQRVGSVVRHRYNGRIKISGSRYFWPGKTSRSIKMKKATSKYYVLNDGTNVCLYVLKEAKYATPNMSLGISIFKQSVQNRHWPSLVPLKACEITLPVPVDKGNSPPGRLHKQALLTSLICQPTGTLLFLILLHCFPV